MTSQQMMITQGYWLTLMHVNENEELLQKNEQLENEAKIVKWACKFFEDGHNPTELLEKYGDMKRDFEAMKKSASK